MSMLKPRRSRRVEPLKDTDYDHEINLLDHSSPIPRESSSDALRPSISGPSVTAETSSTRATGQTTSVGEGNAAGSAAGSPGTNDHAREGQPTVELEQPTPIADDSNVTAARKPVKPRHKSLGSAIDILYENQRGGFLCGIALFASKALGNLDPPPWTNFAHKPSPTDVTTAQVPDPSWEWAWADWKINHDEEVDEEGWEYSFAFSKKFSWHGPKWWNSFVRRRAWIRKRVKKESGYVQEDPSMLNAQYFAVRPASVVSPARRLSGADSRRASKVSMGNSQTGDSEELELPNIGDIDALLRALRASRIDREKIDAIDSYLEHAEDNFLRLQEEMHEIMSLFVFQASRRVLLTRLSQVHYETLKLIDEGVGTEQLRQKAHNLTSAIKHADEEVRRLEYWSDIKEMVVEGETNGAMNHGQGWDESWRGLDTSGPAEPAAPA